MKRYILMVMAVLAMTTMTALADVPRYLDYQGRLMDAAGAAVADANYIVIIKLYDSTQTSVLWTKTYNPVATKNGYFSITLGDTTPQWTGLNFDQQYYIGTQVGVDSEMTPRQAWCAAPYAMNVANGAITKDKLANSAVDGSKILDNTITDHDIANKTIVGWNIADKTVTGDKIADGAVDQVKAPFAPKVNGGISNPKILCAHTVTDGSGNADITFSSTFNGAPVVLVSRDWTGDSPQFVNVQDVTSTGFHANTYMWSAGTGMQKAGPIGFNWIAIGN